MNENNTVVADQTAEVTMEEANQVLDEVLVAGDKAENDIELALETGRALCRDETIDPQVRANAAGWLFQAANHLQDKALRVSMMLQQSRGESH